MKRLAGIMKQALQAVMAYRVRSFFCLISVALGISSIAVIVAATEGAYKRAFEIVGRFGPDSLLVIGGSEESRALGRWPKTIKLAYVEAVRQAFPTVYMVVPMTFVGDIPVSFRDKKHQTRVIGSTADYTRAWTWPVIQGSDFTEEDIKGIRNVGLIGQEVSRELFGETDPVGKYILVRRIPVRVAGVLAGRGITGGGHKLDNRIVLPITTVMKKFINETQYITAFRARFVDQHNLKAREEELRLFLRQEMHTADDQPDPFRIVSPTAIIKFLVALTGSLVAFIGIAGIICLIVAGFVLANLFLLSVKERTKEIGIRRAIGARRRDIVTQFLGESVIITSIGGIVGFILALLGSRLLTYIAEFPMYFSWKAFAVGMGLSWIVGIASGLQPASRAAQIEPIEAIRE